MREALAESNAVIILLTRSTLQSSNIAFEVGFAMAWNKPVYVLFEGVSEQEIPAYLRDFHLAMLSELGRVVEDIAASRKPLSDEDREVLAQVYQDTGIPTDQLLRQPHSLHELSARYNEISNSTVPAERLVQELIRLRKQGRLPRLKEN
jgi:hypothetical protein